MVTGGTKRIVVIRDIPSNLIEEAILILRNENDNREMQQPSKTNALKNIAGNDFLVKEAELIINNYIRENKLQAAARRDKAIKHTIWDWPFLNKLAFGLLAIAGALLVILLLIKLF